MDEAEGVRDEPVQDEREELLERLRGIGIGVELAVAGLANQEDKYGYVLVLFPLGHHGPSQILTNIRAPMVAARVLTLAAERLRKENGSITNG